MDFSWVGVTMEKRSRRPERTRKLRAIASSGMFVEHLLACGTLERNAHAVRQEPRLDAVVTANSGTR
jgi:hypothetical protein